MRPNGITFSIESHAVWAPGIDGVDNWTAWCNAPFPLGGAPHSDPPVSAMAPMLRRRAGALGKIALEVAYRCIGERADVDTVFCSRHGDVARSLTLLGELVRGEPLSPTAFGMAVHNANAGLLSIARQDRAQHIALAGADATFEHGMVEACGLLADGAERVLLVVADCQLPELMRPFEASPGHPYALALMVVPPGPEHFSLTWEAGTEDARASAGAVSPDLNALRFLAGATGAHERAASGNLWRWGRHA